MATPSMRCGVPRASKLTILPRLRTQRGLSLPVPSRRQVASNGVAGWAAWRAISAVMRSTSSAETVCVQPRGSVLAAGPLLPSRARQRLSPVTVPACKSQSHRPSDAAEMVSESSSSRSRIFSSVRLRSVMSWTENIQHGSPSKSVMRMDCSTVRGGAFRGWMVTS